MSYLEESEEFDKINLIFEMKAFVRKIFRVVPKLRFVFYKYYNRLLLEAYDIQFGRRSQINNKVYLSGMGQICIGDDFVLSSGDSINPICRNMRAALYTMTPEARIEIGNRVGISSSCLWAKERITIGNDVNIGGDCILIDNDAHPHDYIKRRDDYMKEVGWESYLKTIPTASIQIEDDVWIGARCIILKGVHIGARTIIAAGSVVTKDIPADVIAGGNPCEVIREINRKEDD